MPGIGADALRELIRDVVVGLAPDAEGARDEGTLLREDLGYDSLALAELAFALEEIFRLPPMPTDETADVTTSGDVESLVVRLIERGELSYDEAALRDAVRRTATPLAGRQEGT
jgi:acyl carrier protein